MDPSEGRRDREEVADRVYLGMGNGLNGVDIISAYGDRVTFYRSLNFV